MRADLQARRWPLGGLIEECTADQLTLPDLGDERFGFVIRIGAEDRWDIRATMVRSGSTLLVLSESEFPPRR